MSDCSCHSHGGFLTERGIELAQQLSLEGLTPRGDCVRVDIRGSVSALVEGEESHVWDDLILDEQSRRFYDWSFEEGRV